MKPGARRVLGRSKTGAPTTTHTTSRLEAGKLGPGEYAYYDGPRLVAVSTLYNYLTVGRRH
jgi:hypothetical protein